MKFLNCLKSAYTSPHEENTGLNVDRGAELPGSFSPCPPLRLCWPNQWLSIAQKK